MPTVLTAPRWETPDPPGVAGTYGDAAIRWAKRELKIKLGPWQQYAIRRTLEHDAGGDLIHRTVLLSTGRQNGKSVIVRVVFGWLLDEGQKLDVFSQWTELLAAAHDAKQARIIYSGVYRDLVGIPRLADAGSRQKRQDKTLRLTEHFGISIGGLTLDTVTGQPGSSRGHSAGAIAWDEVLTQEDWDGYAALSPTQAAQRSPLLIMTSTAGFSSSIVLRTFYDQLVRQATGAEPPNPRLYGAWWQSTDPAAGLDWEQVQQANPALGDGRLTKEFIANEHASLPPDHFSRERLNHWQEKQADSAINPQHWGACRVPHPLRGVDGPYALGVDVALGATRATLAVAAVRLDGRVGVEVLRDLRAPPNSTIASGQLVAVVRGFEQPLAYVAYDKAIGVASALDRDAAESGLPYDGYQPGQMVEACMDVAEMISSQRLAVDDPLLDAQAPYVARRTVGNEGAFRFTRTASSGDIDAFMAMTLAAHAIAYTLRKPQVF